MPHSRHGSRSYRDAAASDWKRQCSNYHKPSRKYNQIVVFGDSLSDTGNLVRFLSGQPTQGQTLVPLPSLPSLFSNGPLWIEQLTPKLGLKPEKVLSFAFAGATTGKLTIIPTPPGVPTPPGLLAQVDQYRSLTAQAGGINPKALHVVFAGANDFLALPPNLLQGLAIGNLQSFIGFAGAIIQSVQNVATAVTHLALGGATAIAVANLPNLGRSPLLVQQGGSLAGTLFSVGFNVLLDKTLVQLERSLKVDITQVDLFSVGEAIARRPQEFGITNLTTPLKTSGLPANTTGFFYWDDFHPTTQIHTFIADTFARSLAKPQKSQVLNSSLATLQEVVNSGAAGPIATALIQQVQQLLPTYSGKLEHLNLFPKPAIA